MNIILFDGPERANLLPLTFTRPVAHLRIGILTIREKWETYLPESSISTFTVDYLAEKYPVVQQRENVWINGSVCPDQNLVDAIQDLAIGTGLAKDGVMLALHTVALEENRSFAEQAANLKMHEYPGTVFQVARPWDIFKNNGPAIEADFELLTKGKQSQPLSNTNTVIGDKSKIFLEEGAKAEASIFNTTAGPIYLGKNSEVMEGSIVRGGLALCENATLKLATKIYGPTTVGPHSKVGGEVNNSVITGYSNKGHDGFLGNSVIGEWCNLGADTNNSNLKNNYADVRLWNYPEKKFVSTGLQFCGLIMGDHSKCGINTMFNTGTVVGVFANIFGSGFPRNYIPSFSWGGASKMITYRVDKTFEVAERVMERRSIAFTEQDKAILTHIFETTAENRSD